ncbi:MAG: AgmX/PglI C-terminal domain-containing protein [Kofleriaceae bacterium]|nr:AgmX/PglI C-terminal domain-containing protein [Kofleriaceae bacterium]
MRRPLLVMPVLAGCWTSSQPSSPPGAAPPTVASAEPAPEPENGVGVTYGGATYGGATYAVIGVLQGSGPAGVWGGTTYGGIGVGWGTIGTGTIGQGTGGGGSGGRSGPSGPRIRVGDPTSFAGLDRDVIRRLIRRELVKIRACYERQLVAEPQLAGKVALKFTVKADGHVDHVATTTSLHPDVDACLEGVVRTIVFPKPQGGGMVVVNYPFVFQPT